LFEEEFGMPLSRGAKWSIVVLGSLGVVGIGLLLTLVIFFWPFHFAMSPNGSVRLGTNVQSRGMMSVNQQHDGATTPALMGGLECHARKVYPGRPELYAYFKIDPSLKQKGTNYVVVEVEYFDGSIGGHFRLDYDSHNGTSRNEGAYTQSKEKVYLKGTQRWRKGRFLLDDARFEGRQNDAADFRVTVVGNEFFIRSVEVGRL
jgi:hypothetical protein